MILPEIFDGEDKSSPLKNCLRNNYKHIRKWAKRTHTNAFRIYDHAIKEYPLTIDIYGEKFKIQYFSHREDFEEIRPDLEDAVLCALQDLFHAQEKDLISQSRKRRKKREQYEKQDNLNHFFTVYEYGALFKVNLEDYIDTGLFLDHRETRRLVSSLAKGKRLLNLFAYTCSFSVHASLHGALFTKSVDLSNTYTAWGKENFDLNGLDPTNNLIIRNDCLKFLFEEALSSNRYDLIVIDPPTLSRSKKMENLFDIQRDYSSLLKQALKLLVPTGTLFFSTNRRRFALDTTLFPECTILDITKKTLPLDFHNQNIHKCWIFTFKKT